MMCCTMYAVLYKRCHMRPILVVDISQLHQRLVLHRVMLDKIHTQPLLWHSNVTFLMRVLKG